MSSGYTDDIVAAKQLAYTWFNSAGVDTDIIDSTYADYTGISGTTGYYKACSIVDAINGEWVDPIVTHYGQWQTGRFWDDLATWYNDTYQVSDGLSATLDAAKLGSSIALQSQRVVTPSDIVDTTVDTIVETGEDIKKAAKVTVSVTPLVLVGLAIWWLS